ncbi:MAG: N-acyl homoserine lactonase family protein [Gammaproteobacteria bacterium]|nr:N-acyl homoserine lactonase family protein [Gammaproteobacteria bacterium]
MFDTEKPDEPYEVYAVRYGHHDRPARDNFIFADAHDGPMPLDFFVWAIVGNGRTIVVDLGFDHAGAERRGRTIYRLPAEGLRSVGVDPATVEDVVITHLHYDHCGSLSDFPQARLYLQDREMAFATGRFMTHERLRLAFDVEYVTEFVRAVYDERVVFVDSTMTLAPGVSLHHIGGHTDGLQVVRVWTQSGWLVLASDAVHLYANMQSANPFPIVFNVGHMIDGFDLLRGLAGREALIVPGHDPLVLTRFPCPDEALRGEVARLDQGPIG